MILFRTFRFASFRALLGIALFACATIASSLTYAAQLPAGFIEQTVVSGLNLPDAFSFAPDGRIFFAEKAGVVRVFQNGALLPTPFIDISAQVNTASDRGLTSIAVHPNFPAQPYIYLAYTYDPPETASQTGNAGPEGEGSRVQRITRVTADSAAGFNRAVASSETIILGTNSTYANIAAPSVRNGPPACVNQATSAFIPDCIPSDEISHTVDMLQFYTDGSLYISIGDGSSFTDVAASATRTLNLDSLSGKMLRINPDNGQGFATNPFYDGSLTSTRSKIYSYGLRNPFRFAFNKRNGEPYIGDVGWNSWEEVNVGRGANFGWPCYEGGPGANIRQAGYATLTACRDLYASTTIVTPPVFSYAHSLTSGAATILGDFYEGTTYPAQYQGALFYTEFNDGLISYLTFDLQGVATSNQFASGAPGIAQISRGPDTNLYYLDLINGVLKRIRYTVGANSPPSPVATATPSQGAVPLNVQFSSQGTSDADGDPLTFSWNFGDGTAVSTTANPSHSYATRGVYTATLTVSDSKETATTTVTIAAGESRPTATITAPATGTLYRVGATINFSGQATDAQDGTLSGASLSWTIVLHHNNHIHPDGLPPTTGATGSFVTSDHGDNTWFELCLKATDSAGLTDQKCVSIFPQVTQVTLDTLPSGLSLAWEGVLRTTPFTVQSTLNAQRQLAAAATQTSNGSQYNFVSWSDNLPATHTITLAGTSASFVARYQSATGTGNQPPRLLNPGNRADAEGDTVLIAISATDPDNDPLTYSAAGLPAGIAINSLTGVINGQLAPGTQGERIVTVSVSDGKGGSDVKAFTWTIGPPPAPGSIIAKYRGDFQGGSPKSNWRYLWNRNGPIGTATNYVPLAWDGSVRYDSDGVGGLPDGSELRYGNLNATGGHPGLGTTQAVAQDRFVIAAVTVAQAGSYSISSSTAQNVGCAFGNGGELRVYVNNRLVRSQVYDVTHPIGFDGPIGVLNGGDSIYVASGPGSNDGCDAFNWDFSIKLDSLGGTGNRAPTIVNPGPRVTVVGTPVTLDVSASDADGNPLTFSAQNLPVGLTIAPTTGRITGTPPTGSQGVYNSTVTVSDGSESATAAFTWSITSAGNRAPTITTPTAQTHSEGASVSLPVSAIDPDSDPLHFVATGLPPGLSINATTGLISGTVSAGSAGSYTASVTVDDGKGLSATANFAWTITQGFTTVANYRNDFRTPTPLTGWRYLWNSAGALGTATNYTALLGNGGIYDSDGVAGLPDTTQLFYGNLGQLGGHPGKGTQNGATVDRAVIAAYTVSTAGTYVLSNAFVRHASCAFGNGGTVSVYLNNTLIRSVNFPSGGTANFDGAIGASPLAVGATVYVALGPNQSDGCDGFEWDFTLARKDAAAGNRPPTLTSPGNQTSVEGALVSVQFAASDPDGDPLTFAATGLPPGLTINAGNGTVSGTVAIGSAQTYNPVISVNDGRGGTAQATIVWTVNPPAGTTIAGYRNDFQGGIPKTGWRYLWNANGPVGTLASYVPLTWAGSFAYDSDGLPGLPDASDLLYGHIRSSGGHTGKGTTQGTATDRFVVAAYEVGQAGRYSIINSFVQQNGCPFGNGGQLRIFVNASPIRSVLFPVGTSVAFDGALGTLNVGDVIYVAAGPNGDDGCDSFDWDYNLQVN